MSFLLSMAAGKTYASVFTDLFKDKTNNANMPIIKASEQMYNTFSDKKYRDENYVLPAQNRNMINPFQSRIPKKETIVVESVEEPVVIEYVPEITEHEDEDIPTPRFKISGLVWNTEHPQAILNNAIVEIGDDVSGWVIADISERGVIVKTKTNKKYLIKP